VAEQGTAEDLVVSGLHAGYGGADILRGIDLQVPSGQLTTIIGPNGAGKSTLLKAIFGMVRVTSGCLQYHGHDLLGLPAKRLIGLGLAFVPQGRCNFGGMTVEENLEMGAFTLTKQKARKSIVDIYSQFPLLDQARERQAGTLSGGQQQILEMAMALVASPRLLLLDEPSLGLAPATLGEVLNTVRAVVDSGVTVVMVEQNARQALERSDRGVVLEMGRKALEGPGKELLASPRLADLYLGGTIEPPAEHS
jgi:branched-chain amino acid transport system ATP-binding protein